VVFYFDSHQKSDSYRFSELYSICLISEPQILDSGEAFP